MTHHNPIVCLARFGAKGLLIAGALFLAVNPVTWGIGLALFDHYTNSDAGANFLGNNSAQKRTDRVPVSAKIAPPAQLPGTCTVNVNGRIVTFAVECSRMSWPGPKRNT